MRSFGDSSVERPFGGRLLGCRGAIASEHYFSAQAGWEMLAMGGNAFDAAGAAAFAESVVNPHMYTIGGECPMLLRPAGGAPVAVNGNTMAPKAATLETYRERCGDLIPAYGILAAGVPAAVGAILAMLERYGSLPLSEIVRPARDLARDGFPVHDGLEHMPNFGTRDNQKRFAKEWPGSAALYLREDKTAKQAGDLVKNPAQATVLETLARTADKAGGGSAGMRAAARAFYTGDIAREIVAFSEAKNGLLAMDDLAAFETRFETPAHINFRGADIYKCGPWSQGPVFLQILRIMDGFDLEAMGHNSADYLHLWTEAAKLAFADREQYYADPAQVDVPMEALLSGEYAEARRALVDMARAEGGHRPGDPRRGKALLPEDEVFLWDRWGYGTVHVAAADKDGNLAALTPSGGWIFGNEVIPSLGFPLGTRLQTFYLDPGHPNAPAPHKRPRTTLSPSLALVPSVDGKQGWSMAFGTMGGDQQDQWTSQFFLNRLVFGMDLQEAIEAPKATSNHFPGTFFPHGATPRGLLLEDRIPEPVRDELAARGHTVETDGSWSAGFICAAQRLDSGILEAGADPRGHKARVFPASARIL